MTSAIKITNFGAWIAGILLALIAVSALPAGAQSITIVKSAIPFGEPQDFSFSGDLGDFDLDDDSDGTLPSFMGFSVAGGTYEVTEAPVEGWLLTDLSCSDPSENSSTDTDNGTATIVVDGTETVTCTFENSQLGKILIDKVTFPTGDPTGFGFTLDKVEGPEIDSFTVAAPDPPYMTFLLPGTYSVTETVPAGWELLNDPGQCSNEDSADSVSICAGCEVTCTFVNRTTVESNLGFAKLFDPDTIGPGSASTLRFAITNPDGIPAGLLTFSDDLPAGMTIAGFPNPTSTCGGIVDAPAGGTTIGFSLGSVAGSGSCEVTVDVTTSTLGVSTNTSNELTSTDGIAGGLASDDLTVSAGLPGFTKSFAPSTVPLGGRSTLTFTIDNMANAAAVVALDFTDNLPAGMEIAAPANASTTCGTAIIPPTLTAVAGTSVIILDANGIAGFPALAALATCTVTVDVMATGAGEVGNVSEDLLADLVAAGKASATLTVTTTPIHLTKEFTDDPVPPGSAVTLEFTISNFDREDPATVVAFTDDLTTIAPPLAGLTLASVLANDCGGTVSGVGGTTIGLAGGTVAPESSCTLRVSLSVPAGAIPGVYTNTTGAVTATVGGAMETGNTASDDLFVSPVPLLTKEFRDATTMAPDPVVNPGDDVIIRFTVTNTSATSGATDVAFIDELTDGSSSFPPDLTSGFLPFPVIVALPPDPDPPCGAGSSLALVSVGDSRQGLELTDGSLPAAGMPGDSCTFDVTLTIPPTLAPGIYLNTTEEPTATVDGATRTGLPASDTLEVIAAPSLSKAFLDDPVTPGGTVTLELTLSYPPDSTVGATAITFTDNLAALVPALAGLTATGLPLIEACDPDGPGGAPGTGTLSGSMGDTLLTFAGGSLMPGESCTFAVTLAVPAGAAAGSYTNTTSGVAAMVSGLAAVSAPASDVLNVSGLEFRKEFLPDAVIAGETVTLRFTIQNVHPTLDATITFFADNLAAELPSLAATGPPTLDTCGGTLSGTTFIFYTGGGVMSGASCEIEVPVLVPPGAADGTYNNVTSALAATQGGAVSAAPATDTLTVQSNLIGLSKEFTDDPVAPGGAVTMELTLTNLDAAQAASGIDFTDDLGAALPDLTYASLLLNDCGATVGGIGTDMITVDGAALAAGGSCTIRVSLTVPVAAAANIYTNTTSAVTGMIGGFAVTGDAASDTLTVINLLAFSKSFDGPTVAGGTAVLTFMITNPGPLTAIELGFTDDLDTVITGLMASGLPSADVCGSGSQITGTSLLVFTGGGLGAGESCSFDVEVTVPAAAVAGSFLNTTSGLNLSGLLVADPATASLTVDPPPAFSKAFAPNPVFAGELSTLTFTVDNGASSLAATDLDFTDTLPGSVEVATPPSDSTTCTGGTLTAAAGSGIITYAGGSVAAGATCEVVVDVTSAIEGMFANTSGDLTSSSGNSGPANDTLTVDAGDADLELVKTGRFEPVVAGGYQLYELTVTNLGPALATGVELTDVLPVGVSLVLAEPLPDCGEAAGIVTCDLGDLAKDASATVTMQVFVEPVEAPVLLENAATVTADNTDPDLDNNDVMVPTDVVLYQGVAALADVDTSGSPEVAATVPGSVEVVVKDIATLAVLHQTEVFPAGWAPAGLATVPGLSGGLDALAVMAVETATGDAEVRVVAGLDGAPISTAVLLPGHMPVAMTVIPDDGLGTPLIAVLVQRLADKVARVLLFDAANGAPSERVNFGLRWPIDVAAVSDFGTDGRAELAVLTVQPANGDRRLLVKELTGALLSVKNQPFSLYPVALARVANCCGMAADEVTALGYDKPTDRSRGITSDADGLAVISDAEFGVKGQPIAVESIATFGDSSADEVAVLFRHVTDRAAVKIRDAMSGFNLFQRGFGPAGDSMPLGLAIVPNAGDTVADEVAVLWVNTVTGVVQITVRDSATESLIRHVQIP